MDGGLRSRSVGQSEGVQVGGSCGLRVYDCGVAFALTWGSGISVRDCSFTFVKRTGVAACIRETRSQGPYRDYEGYPWEHFISVIFRYLYLLFHLLSPRLREERFC